jgi:hypothetical protein
MKLNRKLPIGDRAQTFARLVLIFVALSLPIAPRAQAKSGGDAGGSAQQFVQGFYN